MVVDRKAAVISPPPAGQAAAATHKAPELVLQAGLTKAHLVLETLNDQVVKEWAKGKAAPAATQSLYQKEAIKCVQDANMEQGQHPFRRLLLELLARVASGHLNHDLVLPFLETLGKALPEGASYQERFQELLCDAAWVAYATTPSDKKPPLTKLAKTLVDHKVLSLNTARALLPDEMLEPSLLIPDFSKFKSSMLKTNTSRVYRQSKFNLLNEETEGYAKLLTALHQLSASSTPREGIVEHVVSLIGYFDLDPNRVCDLILEAFERAPSNLAFLQVLDHFKHDYIPHILGFKFKQYSAWEPGNGASADPKDKGTEKEKLPPTPSSLYMLAALLLSSGLMDFRLFLPHLRPDLKALMERQELDNFTLQNIASSQQGTPKVEPVPRLGMEDTDAQVLGVLQAVLELKDWSKASEIMDVLEAHGINACFHGGVRRALISLVHYHIEPIYATITAKTRVHLRSSKASASDSPEPTISPNAIPQLTELTTLDEKISPMLKRLDLHIAHDVLLMVKIIRLFKDYHRVKQWDEETFVHSPLATILGYHMLPSLALIEVNPGLLFELWDLLNRFPWRWRYLLYTSWRERGKDTRLKDICPLLAAYEQRGIVHMRYVARRISSETDKEIFRKCSRLTARYPMQIFEYMIQLAEKNDNYIPYYIENYRASTPFSMDVLSFALLLRVGGETRRKFSRKSKAHEVPWVKALANFTGQFYRRYPFTEVAGLLEFIIQQLRAKSSVDLLVFHELLSRMGNNPSFEEGLTDTMIRGRAGGEVLKAETALFGSKDRVPKKSVARLREVLLSRPMGLPLLLLVARQRSFILFDDEIEVAMITGTLYDKCNMVFLQFVEFISNGAGPLPHKYALLVPSLEELVTKLNLDPEIAFHITRPLARTTIKRSLDSARSDSYVDDGSKVADLHQKWYPFTPEAEAAVKQILPSDVWDKINPTLYLMFWSFSLYDVDVPETVYHEEIKRLQGSIRELNRVVNQETLAMDGLQVGSRERQKEKERKKKEIKEAEGNIKALDAEMRAQKEHCHRIRENLIKSLMTKLFKAPSHHESQGDAAGALIQHCVLPRAVLSPEDALYTAKFFHLMHSMDIPNFPSVKLIDLVFRMALSNLFATTEQEAYNLGVFYKEYMMPLKAWNDSRVTYEQEATKTCFDSLGYDKYNKVFYSWNKRVLKICLSALGISQGESKGEGKFAPDILTIKGTVRFLVNVLDVFPYTKPHAEALLNAANQLHSVSQSNPDLAGIQSLIQGYIMRLTPKVETLKEYGRKDMPHIQVPSMPKRESKTTSKSASPATAGGGSSAGGSLAPLARRGGSVEKGKEDGGSAGNKRKREEIDKAEEDKSKKTPNGAAASGPPRAVPPKSAAGGGGGGQAKASTSDTSKGAPSPSAVKQEPISSPPKARISGGNLPPPLPRKDSAPEKDRPKDKDDSSVSSSKKAVGDERSDVGRKERESSKTRDLGPPPPPKKEGGEDKGRPAGPRGDADKDKKEKEKERERDSKKRDSGGSMQGPSPDTKQPERRSRDSPSKSTSRARSHDRATPSSDRGRRGDERGDVRSHSGDRSMSSRGGGGNAGFGTLNVPPSRGDRDRGGDGGHGHLGKRGRPDDGPDKDEGDRARGGPKKSKNEGGQRGGRSEDREGKGGPPPLPSKDRRARKG